jgi:ABC-type Fe3+/spermidine/putrescine transport system ATPase subunit
MAFIEIDSISKHFGGFRALDNCSVAIERGTLLALLGPSGCGKTTLLRTIAGFVLPDSGWVRVGGRDIGGLPANRRNTGLVFQSYALFPHLSVADNVAYGMRVRGVRRSEREERVRRVLGLVELSSMVDRYPSQLSGGQQQRVALARAIVLEPEVMLLDEPFGALDVKLRQAMQIEVRQLLLRLDLTAIFVTHDQEEAMTVSDRIAVMDRGTVQQVGDPLDVYDRPANPFVASFIGSANMLAAKAAEGAAPVLGSQVATGLSGPVTVMIRPENLALAGDGSPGLVTFVKPTGAALIASIALAGGAEVQVQIDRRGGGIVAPREGEAVGVALRDPALCRVFPR